MASERVKQLERQVLSALQDMQQAERTMNEYARGYHLSKTIYQQRQEQLAEVQRLEAEEKR